MKFGSVAFFKKLIVTSFIILLVVAIGLAVFFGVRFGQQSARADWLESVNWALLNTGDLPEDLKNADDFTQYMQNAPQSVTFGPSFDYQKAFPDLYVNRPDAVATEGKVCYLTFDDGPSPVTMQVLKTLNDYGIKATFFVTGANTENNGDVLRAVAEAGHTIGVHTYSHDYNEIYASVDAYLADFEQMFTLVKETAGVEPTIFRFPGGSINRYNQGNYQQIIAEMTRRGFTFYDWNASGEDAVTGGATRAEITASALNVPEGDRMILLLHDRQDTTATAAALPGIIEGLQAKGYRFDALSPEVAPITFYYQS